MRESSRSPRSTSTLRERGPAAAITAHVATGGSAGVWSLASCEPHPRALDVDPAALGAFEEALRAE